MASTALAYSGTFSFKIRNSVTGAYTHDLEASKAVTLGASGRTYASDGVTLITEPDWMLLHYSPKIQREGSLIAVGAGIWLADGSWNDHVYPASSIIAGTYRIVVNVTDPYNYEYCKGSGTIDQ
jgi:hypothetical protein